MNLEEKFLNQAASEKLPEAIVEVGPLTRDPEQFSATATKREGGVGFVEGAAPSAVSGGGKTVTTTPQAGQVTQPAQKQLTQDDVNKMIADPAYRFDSVSNQLRDIFNKEPQSELIPLNRSMREDLSYSMQQILVDKFGVDNYRAGRLADTLFGGERSGAPMGLGLVDVTPFTIPLSFQESGISAGKSFEQFDRGNYGQAALEYGTGMLQSAEAIPAVGMAVKGIKAGAEGLKAGAEALAPNVANVMESGLRKAGMIMDIVPDGKSVAQQAAKSDIGFYSAVENAAINVQRKSGAGQSFLNDIMKGENVKAEEIKWMGLDEFLKGKKNVTKQEVQDYIANNKVNVQEVALGGKQKPFIDTENAIEYIAKEYNMTPSEVRAHWAYTDENDYVDLANQSILNGKTRFDSYTLAGGENYREILLTMPDKRPTVFTVQADSLTKEFNTMDEANAYKNSLMQQYPNSSPNIIQNKSLSPDDANYKSSHFPDQRNILAHLRVNDRVDADGKKMLLIEEVQSDWHQAGRDKGYKSEAKDEYFRQIELEKKFDAKTISPTEQIELENLVRRRAATPLTNRVPDAPFKDTWYQLALKRALQYAAENGYERVGLTTGKQQVDRFDLSKQVNAVSYHPDDQGRGMMLNVFGKNNEVIYSKITPENEVANVIGKETAKKLIETKPIDDSRVLRGLDLQVGGEGMKKYYDEIYPKFLEKYGKKWNAKMGETKIRIQSDKQAQEDLDLLEGLGQDRSKFSGSGMTTVRYIDITPEMKAGVQKGQPLFAAAPIGAATGTAAMQDERKK